MEQMLLTRIQRRLLFVVVNTNIIDTRVNTSSCLNWENIGNEFRSWATDNKRDGIYLFPVLLENYIRWHWSLMLVHKKQRKNTGILFQGYPRANKTRLGNLKLNISKIFNCAEPISWEKSSLQDNKSTDAGSGSSKGCALLTCGCTNSETRKICHWLHWPMWKKCTISVTMNMAMIEILLRLYWKQNSHFGAI